MNFGRRQLSHSVARRRVWGARALLKCWAGRTGRGWLWRVEVPLGCSVFARQVLAGNLCGWAGALLDAGWALGGGICSMLAGAGSCLGFFDQVLGGLVDDGGSQEQGGIVCLKLAQCSLGPA